MDNEAQRREGFFSVVVEKQTYRNLLYLVLACPLSVVYVCALGAGITLGILMLFGWSQLPTPYGYFAIPFGAVLLGAMIVVIWLMIAVERRIIAGLLRQPMPASLPQAREIQDWLIWLRYRLTDPITYKGLLYLVVVNVVIAAISFAILCVAIGTVTAMVVAPLTSGVDTIQLAIGPLNLSMPSLKLLLVMFAPLVAVIALHVVNALAWLSCQAANALLTGGWPRRAPRTAPQETASMTPVNDAGGVE